ncbi:ATP-dependent RecD-like DNA helicase [Streptomyces scopuliridis]|uniref:ATP-dependent RecD-like DNA helicase n=1 Tax=Streptomyces scopuliridis TaxID=452529 RepID=A0ACD4ZR79_9ACTN|nr:ATP-dependent RecD-like DNA helicase [Streptomyces scopuliridis]WSC01005.1 ATP-dependent RecD-like DNA helicase [Streptomyces scopuliridis]WSC05385.1 ATP-dependent RecD-like DNA helicase [Streptomyces scopuliridis]
MSTDRDTAAGAAETAAEHATAGGPDAEAAAGPAPDGEGETAEGKTAEGAAAETAAAEVSEASAELAAQRELRERIEQRKAEKAGPIAAGTKLSGQAADLLAAVRAVESGAPVNRSLLGPRASAAPERPQPSPRAAEPASARSSAPSSVQQTVPAEAMSAVRAVLAEGGAPEALAGQVAAALGEQAAEVLREDPWQLLAVPGVRPEQADGFARALLGAACGPGDKRRAAALVGWLLERAALQGHTALEAASVRGTLAEHAVPDPHEAVRHAIAEGAVLVFQEGAEDSFGGDFEDGYEDGPEAGAEDSEAAEGEEPADGTDTAEAGPPAPVLLGLDRYALAEESLADGLARLVKTGPDDSWDEAAAAPRAAAELIRAVAGHGLVLHTGGEAARAEPVALAGAARALGMRAVVATHSENGRDRLDATAEAVTVAGLLAGTEGPGRDADGMFALDLLVVLDAPQLDVETAAMIVESLPDGSRLVLSGDPGVLWSAGAGRVFADLLAARVCPQLASRTPDPGPIGELVSGIGIGELHQVEAPGKEVVIVPVRDAGEAVHRTVQLVAESVPRAFGMDAGQTQVITVGHGGSAGTRALNTALKQRLNPGPGRFGGFDPGDRIAYVPSPGRTLQGAVVSADAEGLRLDCEGAVVVVPRDRVESAVRHGWALTAHQAAGMRWPAAVVVLPGDAARGLSRPWVYTAFSRGDRHLSVVHGVDQALPHAVTDVPSQERTTRLRPLIESLLAPAAQPD